MLHFLLMKISERAVMKNFRDAVALQFSLMQTTGLFRSQISKDKLWEVYLASFPAGTNPLYKEKLEHECNACRSFVRAIGDVVTIVNGQLVSIWDVKVDSFYQSVADGLAKEVRKYSIENLFYHFEGVAGVKENYKQTDGGVITFTHLFTPIPAKYVVKEAGSLLSEAESTYSVMLRALESISLDVVDTVLELISQNSLYRGEEHSHTLRNFRELQIQFAKASDKSLFCWSKIGRISAVVTRIRNSSIGTLLVDLSEGKELEDAVKAFEAKVAPSNYKRPTALITKRMIEDAQKTLTEEGLLSALERRYATVDDITINNLLFADRSIKQALSGDVFANLTSTAIEKKLDKIEEVTIDVFLQNLLPAAESIEVFLENSHAAHLVSLIAPVDTEAKSLFKWSNKFSWSYTGELTDSIKERVKQAGGNVTGDVRCSLSWFNYDDLDLHMLEPGNVEISFRNKRSFNTGGALDVDMNAGIGQSRSAVENICYPDRYKMREGIYTLFVNQFNRRETIDTGFEVEIEIDGNIHHFAYPGRVSGNIVVAKIKYSLKEGFKIIPVLTSTAIGRTVWGLSTQQYHKVSAIMLSPNYWDSNTVGNKHWFFMLSGCVNEGKARGFFNEFLSEDLSKHRKVLEVIGAKMKTDESKNQLSGIGFSSTQRNSLICRIKGSFTRVVKVLF